jgi:hypothetical protein
MFFYYLCLMIEGSGSGRPKTYESYGSGSGSATLLSGQDRRGRWLCRDSNEILEYDVSVPAIQQGDDQEFVSLGRGTKKTSFPNQISKFYDKNMLLKNIPFNKNGLISLLTFS